MDDTDDGGAVNPRKARQAAWIAAVAAVGFIAIALPAAAANVPSLRVAFIRGGSLWVLDLRAHQSQLVLTHAGAGPAPTGEVAAGVTRNGGVLVWTQQGTRELEPDGWGSTSVAWSDTGRLAIGRTIYGPPHNQEIWTWEGGSAPPTLLMKTGVEEPYPVAWQGNEVVWWDWPDSASIAADGVRLYVGGKTVGPVLMHRDFVTRCGPKLAFAAGGDRYATHGKRIVLGGRDLSRDRSFSWVSPSCNATGTRLVAAAGRKWEEDRFGHEHRAIWKLLPGRRQLTHPPAGWTDESPQVLADGSTLFVRGRETSRKVGGSFYVTERAELERLVNRRLVPVANIGYTANVLSALGYLNYYGHYGWPRLIAVAP
jgi:hypothetical protein